MKHTNSKIERIREYIRNSKDGTLFIVADFYEFDSSMSLNVTISRLCKEGDLIRIMRGIYAKPRFSKLLNININPRNSDIAMAIARNYGWKILPTGEYAINSIGLSTQIPAHLSFISDGPNKVFSIDGVKLIFKHTNKHHELSFRDEIYGLIIQAIRALGKDRISSEMIQSISGKLSNKQKEDFLHEAKFSSKWIYDIIKQFRTDYQVESTISS